MVVVASHGHAGHRTARIGRGLLASVIAGGLALVISSCGAGGPGGRAAGPDTRTGADIEDIQADEFAADPEAFVGERVRITGTVVEIIGPYAFLLGSAEGDVEPVLIVGAEESVVTIGDRTTVTGEVVDKFSVGDVQDELDIALDDTAFEMYIGENYVRASNVAPAGASATSGGLNTDIEDVQVDEFAADPEAFVGDRVRVTGTVVEIVGPYAFLRGSPQADVQPVLVVGAEEFSVQVTETVVVTGEVVNNFAVGDVQDELDIDLEHPSRYAPYAGDNYIRAVAIRQVPS